MMDTKGSKIGLIFNGSPLFNGDAGSGPSNIRRHILENDWLDAIVALPNDIFYNTGIATYQAFDESGLCKIFDTTDFGYTKVCVERPLRLRYDLNDDGLFFAALEKALPWKLTAGLVKVIRSILGVRDEDAAPLLDADGQPVPDSELRDYENVPLSTVGAGSQ
jgi:type I restriction enzyme M protein